jgi:octaprenyl-diphosphate synthase
LAQKVKAGTINRDEIAVLVEFTKQQGGIDYARQKMIEIGNDVQEFIDQFVMDDLKDAFSAYLEYVIQRNL